VLKVAERWFELRRIDDDITLIFEPHVVPFLRCNIWHVRGRDRDLVIDTGMGVASLREFAKDILAKPVTAVATHVHIDHIGNHHEFEECLVHSCEADGLTRRAGEHTLAGPDFDPTDVATLLVPPVDGYEMAGPMLTALPTADYDMRSFTIRPARVTRIVDEGDIIDLGDRAFEVLHLPGHSPGSIGLWEARTEILFSGDAVYDGPLVDNLHHSNVADYARTMLRLRELPARIIHAGHEPSFGRERLIALADAYLENAERHGNMARAGTVAGREPDRS
jgi:glyoxylase-like metal-dependent hydrolase (beta-lactamase superfamily II)